MLLLSRLLGCLIDLPPPHHHSQIENKPSSVVSLYLRFVSQRLWPLHYTQPIKDILDSANDTLAKLGQHHLIPCEKKVPQIALSVLNHSRGAEALEMFAELFPEGGGSSCDLSGSPVIELAVRRILSAS